MNWEAIGALGEIFGGFTVILTLIYLALQVKLARKATMAQIYQARSDAASLSIISHRVIHKMQELISEGKTANEALELLTLDEKAELRSFTFETIVRMDNNYKQYLMGFLDDSGYEMIELWVKNSKHTREQLGFENLENMYISSKFKDLVHRLDRADT